jgi:flavin-dependent dehydrogenase
MRCADADAIVIGGGPAGSLAAILLAAPPVQWRVVLVDRRAPGTAKPCGHCLNPRALRLLDRHQLLGGVRSLASGANHHFRVCLSNGKEFSAPLMTNHSSRAQPGLVVERSRLDQYLLGQAAAAGVHVIQSATAKVVEFHSTATAVALSAAHCRQRFVAPLVIGADGVGSSVARTVGLVKPSRPGRHYAFSFDYRARIPQRCSLPPNTIMMFLARVGYLGAVAQHELSTIHFGGMVRLRRRTNSASGTARDPISFLRRFGQTHHLLRELGLHKVDRSNLANFGAVGPMPWRPRRVANHRAALVGDAAGYVEPFTGEGIGWALQSAELLLNAVIGATSRHPWDDAAARHYDRQWRRCIARQQRLCRMLGFALAHPMLCQRLFSMATSLPKLTQQVITRLTT